MMATITVRNLPDEIHRALRIRAAAHGRSTEAEVRELIASAVQPQGRQLLGTELRQFAEAIGGVELDIVRDPTPIEPARFE